MITICDEAENPAPMLPDHLVPGYTLGVDDYTHLKSTISLLNERAQDMARRCADTAEKLDHLWAEYKYYYELATKPAAQEIQELRSDLASLRKEYEYYFALANKPPAQEIQELRAKYSELWKEYEHYVGLENLPRNQRIRDLEEKYENLWKEYEYYKNTADQLRRAQQANDGFSVSDNSIRFSDLEIFLSPDGDTTRYINRDDLLWMIKSKDFVLGYQEVKRCFSGHLVERILEIGIFRGGSAPFLHRFFDARKVVCIDIVDGPVIPLENYRRQHPQAIVSHYGVDQADRERVDQIARQEFEKPIDLIVDDASHLYAETKASFEALFPRLSQGGIYVIEDWSVPDHRPGDRALSELAFELTTLYGTHNGIIDHVGFGPGMMWVRRGWRQLPEQFRLDDVLPAPPPGNPEPKTNPRSVIGRLWDRLCQPFR